jgi:hypothetical protein
MKIGVISDTHDNVPAIGAAIELLEGEGVETILHAGDYCAPFALKRILQSRLPVNGVFGNCDGERTGLTRLLPELSMGPLHLELGGKKICVIHILENLEHEDREASDIIVSGHTHEPKVEHREGRLLVNPGECCGWVNGRRTVAVIDTDSFSADVLEVP